VDSQPPRSPASPVIPPRHWPEACTHHGIGFYAPEFAPIREILPAWCVFFRSQGAAALAYQIIVSGSGLVVKG
jgi:hypothetical protein